MRSAKPTGMSPCFRKCRYAAHAPLRTIAQTTAGSALRVNEGFISWIGCKFVLARSLLLAPHQPNDHPQHRKNGKNEKSYLPIVNWKYVNMWLHTHFLAWLTSHTRTAASGWRAVMVIEFSLLRRCHCGWLKFSHGVIHHFPSPVCSNSS